VDIKWNFWKKAAAKISTSAKNVGAWIRKNYFQDSLLDKVAREVIHAQPERADFLRSCVEVAGSAYIVEENLFYDFLQQLPNRLRQNTLPFKRKNQVTISLFQVGLTCNLAKVSLENTDMSNDTDSYYLNSKVKEKRCNKCFKLI